MEERSRVAVVVDSAASLPPDRSQQPQLYVVPMRLIFGDREYLDGRDITTTQFYQMLPQARGLPTTSAPSPALFLEAFQQAAKECRSVLCLTISSKFSSSYGAAVTAAREAQDVLPGVEVRVMDSGTAAGGEGLVALEAWRAARQGLALDQVARAVESVAPKVRLFAFLDTLYYLWKGGRVPKIAHAGTSLLRIKPLFELRQGEVHTVARPRTRGKAMRRLLELVQEHAGPGKLHATVMHADSPDAAEELRGQIEARSDCAELFISEFTPVMGAHTGPGLVAVAFWSE